MVERREQNFIQRNWRASAAVVYYVICLCDFVLFPIANWWFAVYTKTPLVQWLPLTLGGAGMIHLAFGALLTATSISKTKERIAPSSKKEE